MKNHIVAAEKPPRRRTTRVRTFCCLVLAVLSFATLAFVPAVSANPGHDGQGPVRSGCSRDATTVRSRQVGSVYLELRYSPSCRSVWARATGGDGNDIVQVERTSGGRGLQEARIRKNGRQRNWTAMLDDKNKTARACVWLIGYLESRRYCTSSF